MKLVKPVLILAVGSVIAPDYVRPQITVRCDLGYRPSVEWYGYPVLSRTFRSFPSWEYEQRILRERSSDFNCCIGFELASRW